MNISKKIITFDKECFIGETENFNLETFQRKMQHYIDSIEILLTSELENIDDLTFSNALNTFFDINLNEEDYLDLMTDMYGKRYTGYYQIPTTMVFKDISRIKPRNGMDFWDQNYQVYLLVATSNEFKLDYNRVYSKTDVKKLISDKDIVVLGSQALEINDKTNFEKETREDIPSLNLDIVLYYNNSIEKVLKAFPRFGNALRNFFTEECILHNLKDIFYELENNLSVTREPYINWFNNSKYKIKYEFLKEKLQEKLLKEKNKNQI